MLAKEKTEPFDVGFSSKEEKSSQFQVDSMVNSVT